MTDTVRVTLEQIDEDTGKPISKVTAEWYGNDRNTANMMSLSLDEGIEGTVRQWAQFKAEESGSKVFGENKDGLIRSR